MKEIEWLKFREFLRTWLIILSIFSLTMISWSEINHVSKRSFTNEYRILSKKPIFKQIRHGKSGTEYCVILNFNNDKLNYKISEPDYNFLKNEQFSANLKAGDTVLISREKNSIHLISKNKIEYLDFERSKTNKSLVNDFLGYLFIPTIFVCIVAQFFSTSPTFKFNSKLYNIRFEYILIVVFIFSYIILRIILPPFQIIESGEFIN